MKAKAGGKRMKAGPAKPCFLCDGSGQMCDVCGESESVCRCENNTFHDCPDCEGQGKVRPPKEARRGKN